MTLLTTATLSKTLMKDSYSDLIRNIEKSVLEVSSDFIDDDYKRNLWKNSSMHLRKVYLKFPASSDFINDDYKN